MYEILLAKKVEKYLDKLESKEQKRIIFALEKLRIRPDAYLTRLVGDKSYKFRVGDYRIIIDLNKDQLLILVIKIGHRSNVYKAR
ncbi:MAG: type II toxin-antitoxin system RelE/ParE family toxin [archaeon]|nr:type II toxin-antitoxin system RelE/ParE family toxin [archaeon]